MLSLLVPSRHVVLYDPGESVGCMHPVPSPTTLAFAYLENGLGTPNSPPSASGGPRFRGFTGSLPLRPVELLASLADPTGPSPADGDFYFRAFDGLVTLPAAGYDYGGNWAISTGGTLTRWNGS